jgi:hypothetical protein
MVDLRGQRVYLSPNETPKNAHATIVKSSSQGTDSGEFQIQLQDIYARFTQESQVATLGMLLHKGANVIFFHAAGMSNTWNLEFCRARGDIWIEAGTRGSY